MNKRLDEAITQLKSLPDEKQNEAAEMLLSYLDLDQSLELTPEQIAEIERGLFDDEPYASDDEVRRTFARLTK